MKNTLILLMLISLVGCGSSSSSTTTESLELSGTFTGIDNLSNETEVTVNDKNVTIKLKTTPDETIITGTILQSIVSSGKKSKQEITDVDLRIDSSDLSVFVIGETSLGRIVNTDNSNVSFQFNFTANQTRPTAETSSDWSMDGTK